jgi:pimeloyl-ACP methyl ester carboxylesterase
MPIAAINGVDLYYEDYGSGPPILLFHELATDLTGWHSQIGFLSRRHRVVAFNLRGFPPSTVPESIHAYAHETLLSDGFGLIEHLGLESCVLVGHGTGGNLALEIALNHPERVAGLVLAGTGAGFGNPGWKDRSATFSAALASQGTDALLASVRTAPQRQAFALKDPRGWNLFLNHIPELSGLGLANVVGNAIRHRPSFRDLEERIKQLFVPTLVVVGDQDQPAFEASLFVAKTASNAALAVLPFCGHTLILEEPLRFNELLGDFVARVRDGRWVAAREPSAVQGTPENNL